MAQCVQAVQVTFEDFFLSDMAVPPLKIVGFEGLFGSLMMIVVLLPTVQFLPGTDGLGIHEDSIDTLHVRLRLLLNASALQVMSCLHSPPRIGRAVYLPRASPCRYTHSSNAGARLADRYFLFYR